MPTFSSMAFFSFSLTSVCVLPRTFLMMDFPVSGSRPTVYLPSQRPSFRLRIFPSPFARLFGRVSTSFVTANYTVNGRGKLSKGGTVIRKLSFVLSHAALSLSMAMQFLRRRGTLFFVYSGAIFERSRSLSIDYSGAKYVRSALKIALTWKSLFRVVENGKFLNRLLNGHLEKSAVTGVCPPHVHQ